MAITRFKPSQKLRIIISGVAVFTTAKQIRYGLFAYTDQVAASQKALETLEFTRSTTDAQARATGLAGTWEGLQVQLDML